MTQSGPLRGLKRSARLQSLCEQKDGIDISEFKVHSFIIKLWLEDADETRGPVWHGYITQVPEGVRHYLRSLHDILDFIEPYVAEISAVTQGSRARSWRIPWTRRKR